MNSIGYEAMARQAPENPAAKTEPQDVVCGEMSRSGPILPSWGSKFPSRWPDVFGKAEARNNAVNPVMITLPDGCPVRCDPGDSLATAASRTLVSAGQGYTEETKPRLVLSVCPAPKPAFPPRVLGRDWTIAALLPPDGE